MDHNQTLKGMFILSPARGAGWLCLITLLCCGLLRSVSAQNTEQVPPRTTPTPKIEMEKKTNMDPNAIKEMMAGSLSGTVYYYKLQGDGRALLEPCTGGETFIDLVNSNGKRVAQRRIVPGKESDKNAVCRYDFQDIPAGTYTLKTSLDPGNLSGVQGLLTLDERPYYIMQMGSLAGSHPEGILCNGGGSPCKLDDPIIAIVARKALVVDLCVRNVKRNEAK